MQGEVLNPGTIGNLLSDAEQRAGLRHASPTLVGRKSINSGAAEAGVSLLDTSATLGNTPTVNLKHYIKPQPGSELRVQDANRFQEELADLNPTEEEAARATALYVGKIPPLEIFRELTERRRTITAEGGTCPEWPS
jgi:hypothetical protein